MRKVMILIFLVYNAISVFSSESLVDIKAYEGLTIEQVQDNYYRVSFDAPKTLDEAFSIIGSDNSIEISHVITSLRSNADELSGRYQFILPESKNTDLTFLKEFISYNLENLRQELILENDASFNGEIESLKLENVVVTGFYAVMQSQSQTFDISRSTHRSTSYTLQKIQFNRNATTESQYAQTRGLLPDNPEFKGIPDWHKIRLSTVKEKVQVSTPFIVEMGSSFFDFNVDFFNGVKVTIATYDVREIKWEGQWTNSNSLDALHEGPSPAFEPDIKVGAGWGIIPDLNCLVSESNMPDNYLDTIICDIPTEIPYTMGTTSAEKIALNKRYYFRIKVLPGLDIDAQVSYEFQHWTDCNDSLLGEGNAWAVGTKDLHITSFDPYKSEYKVGTYTVKGKSTFEKEFGSLQVTPNSNYVQTHAIMSIINNLLLDE